MVELYLELGPGADGTRPSHELYHVQCDATGSVDSAIRKAVESGEVLTLDLDGEQVLTVDPHRVVAWTVVPAGWEWE